MIDIHTLYEQTEAALVRACRDRDDALYRLAAAEEVLDSFGACPNPGNCRNCADKLAAYVRKREGPWFNPWTGKMSDGTTVTVTVERSNDK